MKNGVRILVLLSVVGLSQVYAVDPQQILEQMDTALVPDRYHAVMEMTTVKPSKTTSMTLDLLYRKGTGSLMELLQPDRVKGTRLLQKSEGLWLYSPSSGSNKPLRLSPKQSFQGSVFSNGDVSEPHFARDYEASLAGRESVETPGLGKFDALILEGKPRTAQAQYGGIKAWVQPGTNLPLKIEYTAKSGLLFKKMEFSDFRSLAGSPRPTVYRMESFEESGTYTILKITAMEARPDLSESPFTENGLTR